jgi:exodeoxyribonuclease-3
MFSVSRKVNCRPSVPVGSTRLSSVLELCEKKGYSGTALFSREEPLSVSYGIGVPEHDTEGRVITAEFPEWYLVTCYTPNSQDGLQRLPYRMIWEDAFRVHLKGLEQKKPVISAEI